MVMNNSVKKSVIFTIVLLSAVFLVGNAHALKVSPNSITVQSNAVSYFNFTFYNNQNTTQNISLNLGRASIIYSGYFYSIGAFPDNFELLPGQAKTVLFSFESKDVFFSYPITMQIPYSDNGLSNYFNLSVAIIPITKTSIYLYSINSSKSFYPYNNIYFQVNVMNSLGQTGLILPFVYNLSSNGKLIYSSSKNEVIGNLGLNSFNFTIPISTLGYLLPPGKYNISVYTNYNKNSSALYFPISVLTYYKPVISKTSSFNIFGGSASITVKNEGNVPVNRSAIALGINSFNSLFLVSKSSSNGSAVISNGLIQPSISSLMPGQSITLQYSVSYYPIYLVILIIALAFVIFLYFNRKVVFKKEVIEHKAVDGFIDIKIALRLKNISRKKIYGIELEDEIPPNSLKVAKAGQKEGKITKHGSRMLISWKEEELNPNDEIIVMYEVKSKIGIVGNFELEKASVKFDFNGRSYRKSSNSLVLHIKT
ncbi:hypothetical protein M1585_04155 [Candidatus Parvarchaeota archaeon]|nr:hypothetical protein [Candidatus Parvarchaeota archaeon]